LRDNNKKAPKYFGALITYNKVMTLQTPVSVCLPPPLNIYCFSFHYTANMQQKTCLNKFFSKKSDRKARRENEIWIYPSSRKTGKHPFTKIDRVIPGVRRPIV